LLLPQDKKSHAYYRIKDKKGVVALKPRIVVFFVVIGMQNPQKSVHNVLVAKPSHKLHYEKSSDKNGNVEEHNLDDVKFVGKITTGKQPNFLVIRNANTGIFDFG
jgi:hypothetical protein